MARDRVLVVEDEADIAALIRDALQRAGGMDVEVVGSGDAALAAVAAARPDAIVLDLNLPVLDGVEVCRILRARSQDAHIPIVMLTARATEDDRVRGLELGADDYITKPFGLRELTARVRAVLRRSASAGANPPSRQYRGERLTADFDAVAVAVNGRDVSLTRREFQLFEFLVQNKGRVISRDRLLERVWGYDTGVETRSVDVHVGRLRAKLGPAAGQIETVVGLGYRFRD